MGFGVQGDRVRFGDSGFTVNPAGTDRPMLDISARLAPLGLRI